MSSAGVLGCSGCTSGSKSGSISGLSWALVFLSLLGTVFGAVSALLYPFLLPCWFASAVMNSGVGCVLQTDLSVDAALMLPDDFDVALLRVWLGLKRSLTDRFVFDGLFSASGLGQPLLLLLNRC